MTLGAAWPLVFVLGPLCVMLGGVVINAIALGVLVMLKVGK